MIRKRIPALLLANIVLATSGIHSAPRKSGSTTPKGSAQDCVAKLGGKSAKDQAGEDLLALLSSDVVDAAAQVYGETRSLKDFTVAGDANLAVKAPFTVMNAAQRMLALIYSFEPQEYVLPISNERVTIYPFFSDGLDITDNRLIVGNEKAIEEFVRSLKAQSRGDRSSVTVPLFTGSHGTGKSEFLTILAKGAENLTRTPDSKFASYTFEWKDLGKIDSLVPFLTATRNGNKVSYANIPAPLGDSPFTLFPPDVQQLIIDKAANSVKAIADGQAPAPFTKPDPISQFIRAEIISHYQAEKGSPLTSREIVDILDKHVNVRRIVIGRSSGKMPLIDAQGNDIDVAGLFMTPNPVVRFASGAGPTHVMSWYLNGKLLQGHGNAILLDEFMRNPSELRDMLLGGFESREIAIGGAPQVPFDAVMVAATNTASLEDVISDPKGHAAADRFKIIPMRWPVDPHEVAQVLLIGKLKAMHQQSLTTEGEQTAPVERAEIRDLFPRRTRIEDFKTPDYRFRVSYSEGQHKVDIAPHTLVMMAELIAATRMHTSPEEAVKLFPGKIATSPWYRDPVHRLTLFEGRASGVTPSELSELNKLSLLTKEGEKGISARDAAKWLAQAISEAAENPANGATLTPSLALQVFRKMLNTGSITYSSQKQRMEWEALSIDIPHRLLVPRLEGDINNALANGDQVVNTAYFEMLDEMIQLDSDPNSTAYISSSSRQQRNIDRGRLQKVMEIYKQKNGRDLNVSRIAMFHARQNGVSAAGREPDRGLFESIAEYYAQLNTQVAGMSALVEFSRTGEGGEEIRHVYSTLLQSLERMGYNQRAALDALNLVQTVRAQSGRNAQ